MSMDTLVFGAIRPPPESCEERGKWLKREPEPEPEPESKPESDSDSESESESEAEKESESEVKVKGKVELDLFWWESLPLEKLKESDFASRYEDEPFPYCFMCPQFVYKNKAKRKKEEDTEKAVDEYLKEAENLSPFDAIPIPRAANVCGNNFPRPILITKDRRPLFTDLSKLALKKYNVDNQAKYDFVELVKATRCPIPLDTYYITFKAKPKPEDATHPTIFQAHVWNKMPEPVIESCSIKTSS